MQEAKWLSGEALQIEENNRMRKTSDILEKIGNIKGKFHAKDGYEN